MSAQKIIPESKNSILYQLWQKASTSASLLPLSILLAKALFDKPLSGQEEKQDIFQEEFTSEINKLKKKLKEKAPIGTIIAKLEKLKGLVGSHYSLSVYKYVAGVNSLRRTALPSFQKELRTFLNEFYQECRQQPLFMYYCQVNDRKHYRFYQSFIQNVDLAECFAEYLKRQEKTKIPSLEKNTIVQKIQTSSSPNSIIVSIAFTLMLLKQATSVQANNPNHKQNSVKPTTSHVDRAHNYIKIANSLLNICYMHKQQLGEAPNDIIGTINISYGADDNSQNTANRVMELAIAQAANENKHHEINYLLRKSLSDCHTYDTTMLKRLADFLKNNKQYRVETDEHLTINKKILSIDPNNRLALFEVVYNDFLRLSKDQENTGHLMFSTIAMQREAFEKFLALSAEQDGNTKTANLILAIFSELTGDLTHFRQYYEAAIPGSSKDPELNQVIDSETIKRLVSCHHSFKDIADADSISDELKNSLNQLQAQIQTLKAGTYQIELFSSIIANALSGKLYAIRKIAEQSNLGKIIPKNNDLAIICLKFYTANGGVDCQDLFLDSLVQKANDAVSGKIASNAIDSKDIAITDTLKDIFDIDPNNGYAHANMAFLQFQSFPPSKVDLDSPFFFSKIILPRKPHIKMVIPTLTEHLFKAIANLPNQDPYKARAEICLALVLLRQGKINDALPQLKSAQKSLSSDDQIRYRPILDYYLNTPAASAAIVNDISIPQDLIYSIYQNPLYANTDIHTKEYVSELIKQAQSGNLFAIRSIAELYRILSLTLISTINANGNVELIGQETSCLPQDTSLSSRWYSIAAKYGCPISKVHSILRKFLNDDPITNEDYTELMDSIRVAGPDEIRFFIIFSRHVRHRFDDAYLGWSDRNLLYDIFNTLTDLEQTLPLKEFKNINHLIEAVKANKEIIEEIMGIKSIIRKLYMIAGVILGVAILKFLVKGSLFGSKQVGPLAKQPENILPPALKETSAAQSPPTDFNQIKIERNIENLAHTLDKFNLDEIDKKIDSILGSIYILKTSKPEAPVSQLSFSLAKIKIDSRKHMIKSLTQQLTNLEDNLSDVAEKINTLETNSGVRLNRIIASLESIVTYCDSNDKKKSCIKLHVETITRVKRYSTDIIGFISNTRHDIDKFKQDHTATLKQLCILENILSLTSLNMVTEELKSIENSLLSLQKKQVVISPAEWESKLSFLELGLNSSTETPVKKLLSRLKIMKQTEALQKWEDGMALSDSNTKSKIIEPLSSPPVIPPTVAQQKPLTPKFPVIESHENDMMSTQIPVAIASTSSQTSSTSNSVSESFSSSSISKMATDNSIPLELFGYVRLAPKKERSQNQDSKNKKKESSIDESEIITTYKSDLRDALQRRSRTAVNQAKLLIHHYDIFYLILRLIVTVNDRNFPYKNKIDISIVEALRHALIHNLDSINEHSPMIVEFAEKFCEIGLKVFTSRAITSCRIFSLVSKNQNNTCSPKTIIEERDKLRILVKLFSQSGLKTKKEFNETHVLEVHAIKMCVTIIGAMTENLLNSWHKASRKLGDNFQSQLALTTDEKKSLRTLLSCKNKIRNILAHEVSFDEILHKLDIAFDPIKINIITLAEQAAQLDEKLIIQLCTKSENALQILEGMFTEFSEDISKDSEDSPLMSKNSSNNSI